jgi:hypothetical protein
METKLNLGFIVSLSYYTKVQNMLQHEDIAKIEEIKGKFNTI